MHPATSVPLTALLTGTVTPLGHRAVPSGIAKSPVDQPVFLSRTGFETDEQADKRHHGGREKAVHHYPLDHYPVWTTDLGEQPLLSRPGAFGENLSTLGMTEGDVSIGDTFRLGKAIIQISQGRQPCWKLSERFAIPDMSRRVQGTGRTGWYYRVLQEGLVSPDDTLKLLEQGHRGWTVQRIWHHFYVDTMNRAALTEIAGLTMLAETWRNHAARRLASGTLEDWSHRLDGLAGA